MLNSYFLLEAVDQITIDGNEGFRGFNEPFS